MRILVLLALLGVGSPLQAQTPVVVGQVDRRPFVEGGVAAEVLDAPLSLGAFGGSGEFGLSVWQGQPNKGRTATASLRARVEALDEGDDFLFLVSFLVAAEVPLTRRIALEAPIGLAFATGSSESAWGLAVGVGVPVALTNRIAIVPRGVGYLLGGESVIGMSSTLSLGLRLRL